MGPLLLFALLAKDVATRESFRFDTPLLLWLHAHTNRFFDQAMLIFTWLGGLRLLAFSAALIALFWIRKRRLEAGF